MKRFTQQTKQCLATIAANTYLKKSEKLKDFLVLCDVNDKEVAHVHRDVAAELVRTNQLEHYERRYASLVNFKHEVWIVNLCEQCGAFRSLDDDNYCKEHENECELCLERFSDEGMATEHVCNGCAGEA